MLFVCIALICLTQSLFAVELSIYKSFTQVRQPQNGVGDYTYQFSNADYGNIIDGTISWDGTPFVRQEVYNTIQSLENAKVTVRRSTACECETISAKIVDPNSMLLQNVNTGAYFYADKQSVEYTSARPNDAGTTLLFQFQSKATEYNGALSYLIQGISWKPTYELYVTGNNEYKLLAYANIKNDQQREYTVESTHLLGGDVQLANNRVTPSRDFAAMKPSSFVKPIQSEGEHQGLYAYSLTDKYTLRPLSSIRLPFIDIAAKYQFYYKALSTIGTGPYQGVFEKNYDITPNHFMPAGIITVRDNQLLVGQANLPDTPENFTQTFSIGYDYDIRYSVKGNLTSKSDEKATVQSESYELDISLMSFKNKDVNVQFVLQEGIQITLLETTCPSANVQGNQLNLSVQLKPLEKRLCKASVTVQLS